MFEDTTADKWMFATTRISQAAHPGRPAGPVCPAHEVDVVEAGRRAVHVMRHRVEVHKADASIRPLRPSPQRLVAPLQPLRVTCRAARKVKGTFAEEDVFVSYYSCGRALIRRLDQAMSIMHRPMFHA